MGLALCIKSIDLGVVLVFGIHQIFFASWKEARNIYTRMLEFTFPGENVIDLKGDMEDGGVVIRGR